MFDVNQQKIGILTRLAKPGWNLKNGRKFLTQKNPKSIRFCAEFYADPGKEERREKKIWCWLYIPTNSSQESFNFMYLVESFSFVNWQAHGSCPAPLNLVTNSCFKCHNNGLQTSSVSGFRCPHQPQVKSRSLEDELERRLRISRSPLRRTSRIDEITTAYQQQQQQQQQRQQQQQQQYWSSQQQKSSQQLHQQQQQQQNSQNFLRANARALSESELRSE